MSPATHDPETLELVRQAIAAKIAYWSATNEIEQRTGKEPHPGKLTAYGIAVLDPATLTAEDLQTIANDLLSE